MIIDSHEHVILPTEKQVELLKKAGVDKAVLFSTTPHVEKATDFQSFEAEMNVLNQILSGTDGEKRIRNLKKKNEELFKAIEQNPERFYGFGSVPLDLDLKQTVKWIKEEIRPYGFKGIGEFCPGTDKQMQQMETIFCALQETQIMPIWVHTFHPVTAKGIKILMDLCKKYPKVPVIFGHFGGTNWMEVLKFAKEHKHVYIDFSASYTTIAIKCALMELPDQCLYSSDAPFGEPYLYRQQIEYVSPDQKTTRKVLGENIAKLLQL